MGLGIRGGVVLLVAILLGIAAGQAVARTFKVATLSPDGTAWMKALRAGAERIAERTEGRVRFRFYPGGVMGNDRAVLRKIKIGQLQGGALTAGALAEVYPDAQIYSLPLVFRSYAEVDYVRERMDPLILEGLARTGLVAFGLGEGGFAYVLSSRPVRAIEDLRGLKIWIPEGDRVSRALLDAVDVSPIPLPLTDVLTGLQTGLVDTVASSPVGAIALQWHTRVKFLTRAPLAYVYGTLVLERDAFEYLSEEDRETVRCVMQDVMARMGAADREDNRQAAEALRRQGITFVEPSAEEYLHWQAIAARATAALGEQEVYSESMLATLRRHLEAFRGTLPRGEE
jgi:TRAP-type C4-dicarboxylate transport system substrate-binding protein